MLPAGGIPGFCACKTPPDSTDCKNMSEKYIVFEQIVNCV